VYSLPLGEGAVQAVAVGFIYLFTLRGGTGTGGEAHRGPHAQEQLRAYVQPARSQGYQQQGRVSAMKWLLDFFYCRSWREFFALAVLASMAFIVVWALLFLTIALFG
jgi:hypothetical protein